MIETYVVSETRTIGVAAIELFARATRDRNPVHAEGPDQIAHGMLTASHISALFAKHFPGSSYLYHSLHFEKPVRPGDEITTSIEMMEKRADKPIVTFVTTCRNQHGELVLQGEAVMKLA